MIIIFPALDSFKREDHPAGREEEREAKTKRTNRSLENMWFLVIFLTGLLPAAMGRDCYLGNDRAPKTDGSDCMAVHARDPCACSSFQLGGLNVWKPGQSAPAARRVEEFFIGGDDNDLSAPSTICLEPCDRPLGIEKGYILNASITDYETGREVPAARPNQTGCVATATTPRLHVDLGHIVSISGLLLQVDGLPVGSPGAPDFTQVALYYSNGSHDITNSTVAVMNRTTPVGNDIVLMLADLVAARYVTIEPLASNICYRIEILGCQELCQSPLGLSDGSIPDANIHILDTEVFDFGPEKARPVPPGEWDDGRPWCAGEPGSSTDRAWIQVQLSGSTMISGVVIMGGSDWEAPNAITLKHTTKPDSDDWIELPEFALQRENPTVYFERPFKDKFIRLYPQGAPNNDVCMRFELLGGKGQKGPFSMEQIPDAAFTSSSSSDGATAGPRHGRINSSGWCASGSDSHPWIAVDLAQDVIVTGLEFLGEECPTCHQWMTSFRVEYTNRRGNWTLVEQIELNLDSTTIVKQILHSPVLTRHLRIRLTDSNNGSCLRFGLDGYPEGVGALGMESSRIGDEMITASSSKAVETDPLGSLRLGRPERVQRGQRSPPSDGSNATRPWVIVDLGQPTVVSGITLFCTACRGSYTLEHFVTSGVSAHLVDSTNKHVILEPNRSREAVVFFRRAVWAQFVRLSSVGDRPVESGVDHFPQVELWGCRGRRTSQVRPEYSTLPHDGVAASTGLDVGAGPLAARLHHGAAWRPTPVDRTPWLQASLAAPTLVVGVAMQGGHCQAATTGCWVQSFLAAWSNQSDATAALQKITDESGRREQVFTGNFDAETAVTNVFPVEVKAAVVRIVPLTWHRGISMRLGLLGRRDDCQEKLGLEDGRIKDKQINTVVYRNLATREVQWARLNSRAEPEHWLAGDWLTRSSRRPGEWLQVSLSRWTKVTGIITQGRHDKSQWVTRFKVIYRQHPSDHDRDVQGGSSVDMNEFWGNYDSHHPVTNYFLNRVVAMSIRVYPLEWYGAPGMRLELLGCTVLCQSQLGLEDGTIPDSAITASEGFLEFQPSNIRLSYPNSHCYSIDVPGSWIQIDLGQRTQVSGVILQSDIALSQSSYHLKYSEFMSENVTEWLMVKNSDNSDMFASLTSVQYESRYFLIFDRIYIARAMRLYKFHAINECHLKVDFVGCRNELRDSMTCQSWKSDGYLLDGVYELDIDGADQGEPPFLAECVLCGLSSDAVTTRIHHNEESIFTLHSNESLSYKALSYDISLGQILSVIDSSSYCSQMVKMYCGPTAEGATPDTSLSMPIRWINREGKPMSILDTSSMASLGCICRLEHTCDPEECPCHADVEPRYWQLTFTNRTTLPVMEVVSNRPDESFKFFVDPLECH